MDISGFTVFKVLIVSVGTVLLVHAEELKSLPTKTSHDNVASIEGTWKNDQGSILELEASDGLITGKYLPGVGNAVGHYDVIGKYMSAGPKNDKLIVSWVVSWHNDADGNSESSTTWNGIYYPEEGVMYTKYLIVSFQDRANYWKSTLSGSDEFRLFVEK
ncbi:hypothetical protein ACF0H5_017058 [Mactra antiquata]